MRPQFFSWLFDDRNAWEKSLADPRYSYELPMDSFMTIYQIERRAQDGNMQELALPVFVAPVMPMPAASAPVAASAAPFAAMPAAAAAPTPASASLKEEKGGILSQDEIDALLSGL